MEKRIDFSEFAGTYTVEEAKVIAQKMADKLAEALGEKPKSKNMENVTENDVLNCINDKPLEGNSIGPDVKSGQEYKALRVVTCGCGQKHIDVGLKSEYNYISCYKCREDLPDGDSIHWCNSVRFEKK